MKIRALFLIFIIWQLAKNNEIQEKNTVFCRQKITKRKKKIQCFDIHLKQQRRMGRAESRVNGVR
jgi:hypothetical protein